MTTRRWSSSDTLLLDQHFHAGDILVNEVFRRHNSDYMLSLRALETKWERHHITLFTKR
jgi:hypothetical protein